MASNYNSCNVCTNNDVTKFKDLEVGETKITVCRQCGYELGLQSNPRTDDKSAATTKNLIQELLTNKTKKKELGDVPATNTSIADIKESIQSLKIRDEKENKREEKTYVTVEPLESQCFCGNTDGFTYFTLPRQLTVYAECTQCPRRYPYEEWTRFARIQPAAKIKAKTPIKNLADLFMADHISWHRPLGYHHHAIVVKVDAEGQRIKVIHFNGTPTTKGRVEEGWEAADPRNDILYRMDYDPRRCFVDADVIETARNGVGQDQYNILLNNCEHFANFCKTGKALSHQVEDFKKSVMKTGRTALEIYRSNKGSDKNKKK
ncbi:hypothetical protein CAPTEDRAFT_188520 [Capitella teleta]|uniref:LRAT domain-containing protein n=1 Tax=Capitella teleta TaxID=283909 RepID=R7U8H6_CAPTE|nr:hypothetical protein CAPTEDRAFT_188520 [Capitella teleta]|eukprot:ELT99405.1 hypothetical protein CAPTEDRAFT_188520 [Capitella teleta]